MRLPKVLLVVALAGSIGLHWAFLQTVAWAGMIVRYAQEAPVTVALAKTFDGEHPCKLCTEITKAKQSEKKKVYKVELSKLEFPRVCEQFVFCAPSFCWNVNAGDLTRGVLTHAPPVPPPRGSLT
jgi:hypothetical protein